jgi:hypothetical protein
MKDMSNYEEYCHLLEKEHQFTGEGYIYHIAIIDYLQAWDLGKKSENIFKQCLGKDGDKISAVEPLKYALRFSQFIENSVFD